MLSTFVLTPLRPGLYTGQRRRKGQYETLRVEKVRSYWRATIMSTDGAREGRGRTRDEAVRQAEMASPWARPVPVVAGDYADHDSWPHGELRADMDEARQDDRT